MQIILGLGNPGRGYDRTRHNVGWWMLDHLADVWHFDAWRRDGEALVSAGRAGTTHVRLVKPQTYMNLSGTVLKSYIRRPLWSASTGLLVIVDDVALPVGRYRLRASGSAGGHNGLKSIEQALGHRDYARLRIGIAPAPAEPPRERGDLSDFVLSPFAAAERESVMSLRPEVAEAVEMWLHCGIERAMNAHNRQRSA